MNHAAQYSKLIIKALCTPINPLTYTELHHIVPRSQGGSDDPGNLVRLTPHQHLVAHMLLAHMPGLGSQWFSVQAIIDSAVNPANPGRFLHPKLRYKKWLRKRIAYQRAEELRERGKNEAKRVYVRSLETLMRKYNSQLAQVEERYVGNVLNAAGAYDE